MPQTTDSSARAVAPGWPPGPAAGGGQEAPPRVSIVFPCYNEEDCVEPLVEELHQVLGETFDQSWEAVFVDDASTDATAAKLARLSQRYPSVRVVTHAVNSGESAGFATGFREARGELIVMMDADMQHDPRDIPKLVELAAEADCVCGVRTERHDDFVKRASSKIANAFRNFVTGDRVTDAGCTFRVLRREAVGEVPAFNGMHRFLPTLLRMQGYRIVETPIHHRERPAGYSKYGIGNRLWRGILDCFAMRWFRRRALAGRRVLRARDQEGTR